MATSTLAQKKCIPCMGGIPPLKGGPLQELHRQLGNGWYLIDEHHIEKEFQFQTFREALEYVKKVGELAEEQGHHPVILLDFHKVKLTVWTHKVDGLVESDFILAAKADSLV